MKIIFTFIFTVWCYSVNAQIITTIAGNGILGNSGNGGPATDAELISPAGIATDQRGNIYIANYDVVIHKIGTDGIMTVFAGNGSVGYGGNGGPATNAPLHLDDEIIGIAVDAIGNVYFSDGSDTPSIRKVDTAGIITLIAGGHFLGDSGDGGPATDARIRTPEGICFDKKGNMYFADYAVNKIKKVDPLGIISTFAGTGALGFGGDGGPATAALLNMPVTVTADDSGNIYIADFVNDRVRKVNTVGIISTIAGGGHGDVALCFDCYATELSFYGVLGVAVDRFGNVYLSDGGDNIIEKVTKDGIIHRAAGNGTAGYAGDNGPAPLAELNDPALLCFDNAGNLLVTDGRNNRFRKVSQVNDHTAPAPLRSPGLSIYPNPIIANQFTCKVQTSTKENAKIEISDILGQVVLSTAIVTNTAANISLHAPPGLYFITAYTPNGSTKEKLVVE